MDLDEDDNYFDASQNTPSLDADDVQPLEVRNSDSTTDAREPPANNVADHDNVADNISLPDDTETDSQQTESQADDSDSETMQGKFRTKSISKPSRSTT